MSGTYTITMGEKGRVVIPAGLRAELGLEAGSTLILVSTPEGVILSTREQALARIRGLLKGPSLVDELIAERRAEAEREDAGLA